MSLRPGIFSQRALHYLSVKVQSQMQTDIICTRPLKPAFDTVTGLITARAEPLLVYRGKARVYPVAGGSAMPLGDGMMVVRSTQFSVPEVGGKSIRADDMITITRSVDDQSEVNKQFRVIDVSLGGIGDPTRKLACTEWEPNSFHTQP